MLKYLDTLVCFQEIPDETTLAINITGCRIKCPNCHSPWLQEDIGDELTTEVLADLIKKNEGITCVCFMGGDNDPGSLYNLFTYVKDNTTLNTAWYSGKDELPDEKVCRVLDYVKIGPYIEERGPLTSRTTNQRFYRIVLSNSDTGRPLTGPHSKEPQPLSQETRDAAVVNAILVTPWFWKDYDFEHETYHLLNSGMSAQESKEMEEKNLL